MLWQNFTSLGQSLKPYEKGCSSAATEVAIKVANGDLIEKHPTCPSEHIIVALLLQPSPSQCPI